MACYDTKALILTALVLLPGVGIGEPRYAGGDYRGDLVHLGVRDLNPRLSRFTTPDPANQLFSGYQYGASSPVTHADPNGAMMMEVAADVEHMLETVDLSEGASASEQTQVLSPHPEHSAETPQAKVVTQSGTPVARARVPAQDQWGIRYMRLPEPLFTTMQFLNRTESRLSSLEAEMRFKAHERDMLPSGIRSYYKRMSLERQLRDLNVKRNEYLGQKKYYQQRLRITRTQVHGPNNSIAAPWVTTSERPTTAEIPVLSVAAPRKTFWDKVLYVLSQYPGRNWHY